jgi:hypothetical protein
MNDRLKNIRLMVENLKATPINEQSAGAAFLFVAQALSDLADEVAAIRADVADLAEAAKKAQVN